MADKSPAGWDIVDEYEADPIASDSDDNKKIRQAENRALRKKKDKKPVRPTFSSPPTQSPSYRFRIDHNQHGYTPQQSRQTPATYFRQGYNQRYHPTHASHTIRSGDTCFACGEKGQWRQYCPKTRYRN